MEANIPDGLIEEIYKGRTVLFAGAGLSASAGLPNWSDLMYRMIQRTKECGVDLSEGNEQELIQLVRDKDFLTVAEDLRNRMGDHNFRIFMRSIFCDSAIIPSRVHTLITEIPFAAVLTTNYDVLIESAYTLSRGVCPRTYIYTDTSEFAYLNKKNEFYILKMHGDIDRFDTIIFGRKDFRELMFKNDAYRNYLKALFMTKTVIFVGFSLNDPDLLLVFEELGAVFKSSGEPHYALMNTKVIGDVQRQHLKEDYRIEVIPYEATTGHPEVYEILSGISEEAAKKVVSYTLEKLRISLLHSNFIVEGPNPRARRLFVEELTNVIREEYDQYSSFVIQVDMEEIPEQRFFQDLYGRLCQIVRERYPSIEWTQDDNTMGDIYDLKRKVEDIASKIEKLDQKPTRILILFFNADTWNELDVRIKNNLKYLLDELGPTLTAVMVAQKLDTGDRSGWKLSPWFRGFFGVKLQ